MIPGLFLVLSAAAATAATGPACDDVVGLLRDARVVSTTEIGQGITGARRVELESGSCRLQAVFKTVSTRQTVQYRFGTETAPVFADSYKHEIAAYELDKLLNLGLVPPVVQRKIGGYRGSLQVWVSGKWRRFVHGNDPPEGHQVDDLVHTVRFLDYLIFNTDRHVRNFFFTDGWQPLAIDHSIAFHPLFTPSRPLYRFPRAAVERLRALNRRKLKRALGRYLEKDQIKALEQRRTIVLELVDEAIEQHGEEEVFFTWPATETPGD